MIDAAAGISGIARESRKREGTVSSRGWKNTEEMMSAELRFETMKIKAAEKGAECSVPDLLGELILQNRLEFHLDEEDEIYEAYGRMPNAYPYRQYNTYTRDVAEKEIRTAVLENDHLKAVFLPEYGGRLWELWDKETGRNLLYTNDVLRFSNLAVRNAWFSGGVEWNIGVIGHTPLTADSMYTAKLEDEKGTPVLRMYEYERIRNVIYQMDFWLEPDGRVLNCHMRIANESAEVIPMYWWSNIAVPEYENGRVVVPADKAFTHLSGGVYKVDIPMVDGIDITNYEKIPKSVDYFFDIPKNSPKYIANVDENGWGLLHLSTDRLRSRKLFCWGNNDASDHWQEFLTEQAGRYIEIQAGLAKTQYGCLPMAPHTSWEWMEQYGAVQLPKEELGKPHAERAAYLTGKIIREQADAKLEQTLQSTKARMKQKAELVCAGSGYGALKKERSLTGHLDFVLHEDSLKKWAQFFETSHLHCPNPQDAPDEFLADVDNLEFFKKSVENGNQNNWYAHYQLGLGYYTAGDYQAARQEMEQSLALADNPWALHALGCICLVTGRKEEAAACVVRGIQWKKTEASYLKEGFKILYLSDAYETLCREYQALAREEQQIEKLRFYYISALHKLGKEKEAYELLEKDGGLVLPDIREGEDSVANLWCEIYENLYGEKKPVPHRYNFKAY